MPTERRFDITAFFNRFSSEKIEWTSTENSSEDAIFFFLLIVIPSDVKYQRWNFRWKVQRWCYFFFKSSEAVHTLVPDADQVAKYLKVSQFDCGAMTENTLYARNQERQCHITHEELKNSRTKIILYTKNFLKGPNATKCRIQHQREKCHCGHNGHSSINHTIAGITSDLVISAEQCRSLARGKIIYLADQFLGVEYDTKNPTVVIGASTTDTYSNHCTARGWITRDTFLPHMHWTTLKVRMSTGKVLSDCAQVLPCALEDLAFETTSLDPYAYIWDYPNNCVLSVLRT